MVNRFEKVAEILKKKEPEEIKQIPLRMKKSLYDQYAEIVKDLGSNVNEFTVALIESGLKEYKADQERIQRKKSKEDVKTKESKGDESKKKE
jgi:hypothetical protein